MRKYLIMILVIFSAQLLVSCSESEQSTATFESFLLSNQTLVDELKSSNATLAVELFEEEDDHVQRIYVWKNQLRRDFRADLIELSSLLSANNSKLSQFSRTNTTSTPINVSLNIGNEQLEFDQTSDATKLIIAAMFPESFSISQSRLKNDLVAMATRLETLEILGDTEVICLQVKTKESLLLSSMEQNIVHFIIDIETFISDLNESYNLQ